MLIHLSDRLQHIKEIVCALVKVNTYIFPTIPFHIKSNKELLLDFISINGQILPQSEKFKNDK